MQTSTIPEPRRLQPSTPAFFIGAPLGLPLERGPGRPEARARFTRGGRSAEGAGRARLSSCGGPAPVPAGHEQGHEHGQGHGHEGGRTRAEPPGKAHRPRTPASARGGAAGSGPSRPLVPAADVARMERVELPPGALLTPLARDLLRKRGLLPVAGGGPLVAPDRLVIANWKSHKTLAEAAEFARAFRAGRSAARATPVICPPFTAL